MKIASYNDHRIGVVDGDRLLDVTDVVPRALDSIPGQRINWLIANWAKVESDLKRRTTTASPSLALSEVTLLAANPCPAHVFAAPANYQKHIGELGDRGVTKAGRSAREQGFFLKAPASVVGAGGVIELPKGSKRRFDHESELAVIIGSPGRDIPRERALTHVFGYACLIDATMRIEKGVAEEERSMRKSFAGFTPLGPWIVTADEVRDPGQLSNRLWVNEELRQSANTREMIVGVAELIELISSVLPLTAGDVIATGTPEGVGPFGPGDTVRIEIEGVGQMEIPVRERRTVSPRAY
jgi:2-keto-4-pentenoate hydratase/2-oxohepta-3-ene-1,7-dioic acid hydratase in catechol pathway